MEKFLNDQILWGQHSPDEVSELVGSKNKWGQTCWASPICHFLGSSMPQLLEEMMDGWSLVKLCQLSVTHQEWGGLKEQSEVQSEEADFKHRAQGITALITPHGAYHRTGKRKGFACPHTCLWCQSHSAQVTNPPDSGHWAGNPPSAQWLQAQDWLYWVSLSTQSHQIKSVLWIRGWTSNTIFFKLLPKTSRSL